MKNNKKKIAVKCEANVCPICGGMNLEYCGKRIDDDDGCSYGWICKDCGASGREGHTLQFDGHHYDVETGAGEPVEIVAPGAAPNPEEICPVCGERVEENGEPESREIFVHVPWRCPHCEATGTAEYEEAPGDVLCDFNGHGNVHLADGSVWDGKPIPATESAKEEHRITGSITLLNDCLDREYALRALKDANICASEENGQIVIKDTPVSKAVDILANEGILLQAIVFNGEATISVAPPPVKAATGWFVPVTWEMFGVVRIPFEDAPTLADAFKQIKDNPNIILPKGHYVDDSFAPSYEVEQIEEVRSLYNDNRPDSVAVNCSSEEDDDEDAHNCKENATEYGICEVCGAILPGTRADYELHSYDPPEALLSQFDGALLKELEGFGCSGWVEKRED